MLNHVFLKKKKIFKIKLFSLGGFKIWLTWHGMFLLWAFNGLGDLFVITKLYIKSKLYIKLHPSLNFILILFKILQILQILMYSWYYSMFVKTLIKKMYLFQLQGMEQELFGAPSSFRNPMSTKIRLYRRDLAKLQRDIRSLAGSSGFSGQFGDGKQGIYAAENDQSVSAMLRLLSFYPNSIPNHLKDLNCPSCFWVDCNHQAPKWAETNWSFV